MSETRERELRAEEEHPPISQLRDFELEPDAGFEEDVRRRIGNREVASGVVHLSTHGFFHLLMGYLSTLLGVFTSSHGDDTDHKES